MKNLKILSGVLALSLMSFLSSMVVAESIDLSTQKLLADDNSTLTGSWKLTGDNNKVKYVVFSEESKMNTNSITFHLDDDEEDSYHDADILYTRQITYFDRDRNIFPTEHLIYQIDEDGEGIGIEMMVVINEEWIKEIHKPGASVEVDRESVIIKLPDGNIHIIETDGEGNIAASYRGEKEKVNPSESPETPILKTFLKTLFIDEKK